MHDINSRHESSGSSTPKAIALLAVLAAAAIAAVSAFSGNIDFKDAIRATAGVAALIDRDAEPTYLSQRHELHADSKAGNVMTYEHD